jgi:GntR family transcriptional regulator, transcriptional repressor for pyruvate dehydrogenase complex
MDKMFKTIRHRRVHELITDHIEGLIISRKLKVGDKLPSERELTKDMGVSRRTLREAMRVLEQRSLIEIKIGTKGGAFVKSANIEQVSEGLGLLIRRKKVSLTDLLEFRLDAESSAARQASKMASKNDILKLKALVAEGDALLNDGEMDFDAYKDIDRRFHSSVASMTRNSIYEWVLKTIHENIFQYFESYLPRSTSIIKQSIADMKDIVNAIEEKDEGRAGTLARTHVLRGFTHMKKGSPIQ